MGMPIFFNFHYCHLCQSYYYFLSDFFQESESLVKPLLDALMLPLGVLVRVSIVMIEHHDQKQLGEERVYFSLPSTPWSIIKGSQGRNLKAGIKTYSTGVLLIGLLPMTCSACFLTHLTGTCPWRHCQQWAGPSCINH